MEATSVSEFHCTLFCGENSETHKNHCGNTVASYIMCSWNVAHVCKCNRQANCRYKTQMIMVQNARVRLMFAHFKLGRSRADAKKVANGKLWFHYVTLFYPLFCDCIELFTQNLCISHVDISGFICLLPPFKYIQLAQSHSTRARIAIFWIVQLLCRLQNKCHGILLKLADRNELSTCALISSLNLLDHSRVIKLWEQSCCNSLLFF